MCFKRNLYINKLLLIAFFVATSCHHADNTNLQDPFIKGDFTILEPVGDTLLPSDTCYAYRTVAFVSSNNFRSYNWFIGEYKDTNSTKSLNLVFSSEYELTATLIGKLSNYTIDTVNKTLVIYEPKNKISALEGEFLGSNVDDTNDTFTVSINFWIGSRYPFWSDGAYTITNIPKGYQDSNQNFNGLYRPEIRGIVSSTGYKNLAFDKSGYIPAQGAKGYASVYRGNPDTLVINYSIIDPITNDVNKLIHKKFVGLRK